MFIICRKQAGGVVMINTDHIVDITEEEKSTMIQMSTNETNYVAEKMHDIIKIISTKNDVRYVL